MNLAIPAILTSKLLMFDETFAGGTDYYSRRGSEGVDFNANLAITTIDFGTFHVRRCIPKVLV